MAISSRRDRLRHLVNRARGISIELDLTRYGRLLGRIREAAAPLEQLDDLELRAAAGAIRERGIASEAQDRSLVDTFAHVAEIARRRVQMRPFDVQLIAGIVLHERKVAEMQTGEGKTLAAVPTVCLNAFAGAGVHVLTFNDYLARRDAAWMGPIYEDFGLSVGVIQEAMADDARRAAYAADITYATAREVGFDYLRDALKTDASQRVQRPFHFAIVDEADSILIDEARIPLVLAGADATGSAGHEGDHLRRATTAIGQLRAGVDYDSDQDARNAFFTESGFDRLEELLGCGSLHDGSNIPLLTSLNQALHAHVLLRRDVDYIVRDGEAQLVDAFTGRVADQRRWPDGLHAAVQQKESLTVEPEGRILQSITLQHFVGLYPRVAGMTATAQAAAEELRDFYGLITVVIPTDRPCVRVDAPDLVFADRGAKEATLVAEIRQAHATGRPILVGTSSVEESARLAATLARAGIRCEVLNAKNDALEAEIVARAGWSQAVTISTNIAGRGTDIRLGQDAADRERVVALGGLYVLGTNRHESRRIDDQLRGRAGRQGDPGTSRFYVSLEDELFSRHGRLQMPRADRASSGVVEGRAVSDEIAHAQRVIDGANFEIRKTLWRYSSLVEQQRQIIAHRRRAALTDAGAQSEAAWVTRRSPARFAALQQRVGPEVARRAVGQLVVGQLDRAWADHLEAIADLREGIHLHGAGGGRPLQAQLSPFEVFQRSAVEAFDTLLSKIDDSVVASFERAGIDADGLDHASVDLHPPASTWTYVINDDPFESGLANMFRGIARAVRGRDQR